MSYTPNDHAAFSKRVQNFMLRVQALREEAAVLDAIYRNEALSGASENWIDTEIALATEQVDAILWMQSFAAFNEAGAVETADRSQWITPFIQVAP